MAVAIALVIVLGASSAGAAPKKKKPPSPRDTIPTFEQPRWVMMRSLVIPGWGQFHNKAYLKAVAVAGVETMVGLRLIQNSRDLDELNQQIAEENDPDAQDQLILAYNDKLDQFVARQWLLGGIIVYALVDAYVDAHFRTFKVEFSGPDESGDVEGRLMLRWTF